MIAPRLDADLAKTTAAYVELWGRSSNYDASQLAKPHPVPTVDEPVLDALNARAGLAGARAGAITFAGIEHTYGYLVSDLETPYGFKRARWVRDDVEAGFGLSRGVLGPAPSEGTLFANVTYFAGRIAFRDDARERATIEAGPGPVSHEVVVFPYASLAPARIVETVMIGARTIVLRTDYVDFTKRTPAPDGNTCWLIYSILDADRAQLITMFPVDAAARARALEASRFGDAQSITLQFNAWLDGFPRTGVVGSRAESPPPNDRKP